MVTCCCDGQRCILAEVREGVMNALALLEHLVVLNKKSLGGKDTTHMLTQIEETRERMYGEDDYEQAAGARTVVDATIAPCCGKHRLRVRDEAEGELRRGRDDNPSYG